MSGRDQFIGAGWTFPVAINDGGDVALARREQELAESIRLILGTAPGERPMRPEFGCAIHDHVFAAADATTAGRITYEVQRALERWEPRIDLHGVVVTPDPALPECLYIDITYSVRDTNDPRNLVFPFYLIPGEG